MKQGGTEVASYLYDYAGHRVSRTITATPTTVHYVYDKNGHVIAEHDGATGALLREYVWLDNMPLALITGPAAAPQYSYIHSGQLDEPLMVTDASQARQWDAVSDPWGNALPLTTPTIAQDLRLPGQETHIESGLFQNWHRDYDPTLGRYIEADPIGLAGGGNVFAYANGNPTYYTDPNGKNPVAVGIAIGIGISLGHQAYKNWRNGRDILDPDCYDWGDVALSGALGGLGGAAAPYIGRGLGWAGGKVASRFRRGAGATGSRAAGGTGGAGGDAVSPGNASNLAKQLASDEGVAELLSGGGESIAGAGAKPPIKDIARLVSEHGGNPADWAKITSTAEGHMQTHAYKNVITGEVVELKSIIR